MYTIVEIGVKMEKFTFKPEFVYSRGLLNQSEDLSFVFKNIYTNQYSVRFLFYGS